MLGKANGKLNEAGARQHLAFDPQTPPPLCNLYVQMLRRMGIDTSSFGSAKATKIPGFDAV